MYKTRTGTAKKTAQAKSREADFPDLAAFANFDRAAEQIRLKLSEAEWLTMNLPEARVARARELWKLYAKRVEQALREPPGRPPKPINEHIRSVYRDWCKVEGVDPRGPVNPEILTFICQSIDPEWERFPQKKRRALKEKLRLVITSPTKSRAD